MKSTTRQLANKAVAITTLFCMATQGTFAAFLNLAQKPLFIGGNVPPQVMLTISKDQQLYKKAYNDYSDLDGDGQLETTYTHKIDYYGYFDPVKCYDYDMANNRFVPKAMAGADKYCSGLWSGNFLNWVSMSRMDTVRKLLYGGMRSTDGPANAPTTVLERAYLPTDAHAWAKYYNGTDIAQLTPFKQPATTTTTLPPKKVTAQRVYCTVSGFTKPDGTPVPPQTFAPDSISFVFPPLVVPPKDCVVPGPNGPISASVEVSDDNPQGYMDVIFNTAMGNEMAVGDQIRLELARDDVGVSFDSRGGSTSDCSGAPTTPCLIGTVLSFSNSSQTLRLRVHIAGTIPPKVPTVNANELHVTNLSRTGISFCNVTTGAASGDNKLSHTNRNSPLIRVASGNFQFWGANERYQCMWADELRPDGAATPVTASNLQGDAGVRSNGNQAALSGLNASAENPAQASHGLGTGAAAGEYVARVEACVSPLFGTERCKRYDKGNYKPIGLLQEYGDVNLIHFGLMTGSYRKNVSGGVLRKNVGSFNDEVNHDTDGTFKSSAASGNAAVPPGGTRSLTSTGTPEGIVSTLNYLRIWGYDYPTARYIVADNCTAQLTNIAEDKCTSWGNPMAEIYFESLRYFAGGKLKPTPAFDVKLDTAGSKDNQLGLPLPDWKDNLSAANYCAPLNTVVFNASVSTNDDDLRKTPAADINSDKSVVELTNTVGTLESIDGNTFFAGKIIDVTAPGAVDFELCTAKKIPGLGEVSGICPEGASVAGSYLMAGLAHHARTKVIRTDIPIPSSDKRSLKVTTYGIQLATNVPQIVIPVPDSATGQKVVIQPIYRLEIPASGTPLRFDCAAGQRCYGGGTLVDMKFIKPIGPDPLDPNNKKKSYGKVYINWEDSEQGGDYDQDMVGTLEWRIDAAANTITVTTHALTSATVNPQGFGYSISGTDTHDGPHFFSGIAGLVNYSRPPFPSPSFDTAHLPFNFTDPTGATGTFVRKGVTETTPGCVNCRAADDQVDEVPATVNNPSAIINAPNGGSSQKGPVSATFQLKTTGTAAGTLQDPLWYAAKYGAFVDSNGDGKPDNVATAEWDQRNNNTGQQIPDGIPDTYFLVTNPLQLLAALDRAFVAILSNASAASVATSSTSLQTSTTIYQARFNANDWSGQVLAFSVLADGTISPNENWDAGKIVSSQNPSSTSPPAASKPFEDPSAAGRTILTHNDSPVPASRKGVPFRWPASLSTKPTAAELAALSPTDIGARLVKALNFAPGATPAEDFRGQDRLNYLRGSQAKESVGTDGFRPRPLNRLGDIANSSPNFVGAPNAGFGEASYAAFRQQNSGRKPVIYVGGNDGMLHGFRAEDGREILAYVPSMVHDKLNLLTSKTYVGANAKEHRYFVDGSPEISDALISTGATFAWRTVLVGGLGAGGQGVFALNITKPEEFAESKASEIVMWEFSDRDDPDMGYVLAQPTIRRTAVKDANGINRWAAIVPAGYNNSEPQTGEISCTPGVQPPAPAGCTTSPTGSAYLFIIFLDGPGTDGVWDLGTDYIKIQAKLTGATPDDPSSPNGLTQPIAADVTADGIVDYLYAGDLRGNLWKFDITSTNAADWSKPDNRVILFTAMDTASTPRPQPITAKPEATLHPDGTGFIITFGTGKYLEPSDPFNPPGTPVPPATKVPYQLQSFYGIWDRNDQFPIATAAGDGTSVPRQTVVASRSLLLGHEIRPDTTGNFRVVVPLDGQPDQPNWFKQFSSPPPSTPVASDPVNAEHMGWYLDLPDATDKGERSVFRPILTSGRLIFTTLLPLTEACEFGGSSFLMVIDPTTGGRIEGAVLDVKADQTLNSEDKVSYTNGTTTVFASGAKSTIGITPTPTIIKAEGAQSGAGDDASKFFGTSGPLLSASSVLLAYALAAGSSGGNASTMIGLSAAGGRVSWRELMAD